MGLSSGEWGKDICFADESGFEGDPRPRKRWDKKARKTRVTKNGGHLRMNVIGIDSHTGKEGKKIRSDPISRVADILKELFGAQA